MHYKPTPLNIFSVFIVGYSVWAHDRYFIIYSILFGLLGLLIDFVIQAMSKKYTGIFIIEILIILVFLLAFY